MNSTISRRATICARARVLVTAGLLCASASLAFGQTQPSTNRSRTFGPDACGPADPAYIHTANETGGIPRKSVHVSAKLDFGELSAGSTKQVAFTMRNIGFPSTFNITVTDAHQFVSKVEPKE